MIEILPAIDIIDGRCVRLSQGDYERRKTYDSSPVEMVHRYADCGLNRIHVVDLDGAKADTPRNLALLEKMALISGVSIEWGGGIKNETSLHAVFESGASYAVVGSTAAKQPALFANWLERFGAERMVLGADIREGKVSVSGWLENLDMSIETLTERFLPHGLRQVVCTDISRDGMLQGPSVSLYKRLQRSYDQVDFTVSGGIASMDDIRRLDKEGLRKVIVGKAIYEGCITLNELEQWAAGLDRSLS